MKINHKALQKLKNKNFNKIIINPSIFKSYDIRGIYPDEINEKNIFLIGKAFVKYTKAKKIAICYDTRISSPSLFKSLIKGITEQGSNVYFIGQLPTECLYFAVGNYDFDAGIMITASHNPKEYNGLKTLIKKENEIIWIRGKDLFLTVKNGNFRNKKNGKIYQKDIIKDYLKYIFSFNKEKIKPFKIAIDASSGVAGKIISLIKKKLDIKIIKLNFKPDGNFKNHSPNPLEKGSSDQISQIIKEQKLDFGIMFDGDADRIFLIDEKGNMVSADIVLLFLAKYFLEKKPGSVIAYNAICSKVVPEFIKKWGGIPIRTAVGFVNVREGLIKNNGIMGGELSAHYSFKDYFCTDSGMIAFLILLQIISKENKLVSKMVKEFSLYFKSAEINLKIQDKEKIFEKTKEKYFDGKQDFLDGITVEYKDWWFNLRLSNTEPLLRVTIEANSKELLEKKKKELIEFINAL